MTAALAYTPFADDETEAEPDFAADASPLSWRDDPPFRRGDRIVERDNPAGGSLIVTECRRHPSGSWRVDARRGLSERSAPASRFVLAPPDWTEPPPLPRVYAGYLDLPAGLPADDVAECVDLYLGLSDWWLFVGKLVNPDLAEREAAGLRRLAALLAAEDRGPAALAAE